MIRLLALSALLFSVAAHAEYMTSNFQIFGTFVDLVQIEKKPSILVEGKALYSKDLTKAHIVVAGKPFNCQAVHQTAVTKNGPVQVMCIMDPNTFLAMLNLSEYSGTYFTKSGAVLVSYYSHTPSAKTAIFPIAFAGDAGSDIQVSDYTFNVLEPQSKDAEVDFEFNASGGSPF